jgi:L-ascorbate metabolism protein UlaG (beta-lactamase superfamily)
MIGCIVFPRKGAFIMKRRILFALLGCFLLVVAISACAAPATPEPTATPTVIPPTPTSIPATTTPSALDIADHLSWFGTASFLYRGSQNIYFDPVTLSGELPPADIILISHAHSDHWSPVDLVKIIGPNTTLVISPNVTAADEASQDTLGIPATTLEIGDMVEINGVEIEAVPAYGNGHPIEAEGAGFIVTVDGERIYFAGGTNTYPEMADISCEVALLPLYSSSDILAMAETVPAKIIIPMHTSEYAAQAYATVLSQQVGGDKQFISLPVEPYQP